MPGPKTLRDRELRGQRATLINSIAMNLDSIKLYFMAGDVSKMMEAADRAITNLAELRDNKPNEERRRHVVAALESASSGEPLQIQYVGNGSDGGEFVYINGHIELNKLVSSVVFVRQPETIEMKEIR